MMSERRKVLAMLHEHKIDVDEAEGLLDALEYAPEQAPEPKVEYITANPKTQAVLDYARKAAPSSAPVMIVGESGTGKLVLARLIHQESGRRDKPFVYVNCMSLTETLFEADLFGYERGAFTGANQRMEGFIEQANGGTLFLDSVDELPMSLQVKLLPFVKTGEFRRMGSTEVMRADVRLVSITNKDLQTNIQASRFSQNLHDCLSVIRLDIPPLRERAEDIPLLANYFLEDYATQSGRAIPTIAPEAMDVLTAYTWPGNARELSRVIQSALVLCDGDVIEVEHLADALTSRTKLHEHKVDVDEAEVEYITANPKTQEVLKYARKAASSSSPVLIVGEAGTGKELVARMVHQEGNRRNKPFIFVNCALLSESELFGHVKFRKGRIDEADGGTLFLDEIGDLPASLQVKLLRFIRNGEFEREGTGLEVVQADVRIIAAISKDLREKVETDLMDSLGVTTIKIPPLRERVEDIPLLAEYFLRKCTTRPDGSIPGISQGAMNVLMGYPWPGNVRELSRVIQSVLVLCDGDVIEVEHLPDALTGKGK